MMITVCLFIALFLHSYIINNFDKRIKYLEKAVEDQLEVNRMLFEILAKFKEDQEETQNEKT